MAKHKFLEIVYVSMFSDCTSSNLVYERLINVINNQLQQKFYIVPLDLYNPIEAAAADSLGVFDAPCISCLGKHLQGLVDEDTICKFLKGLIEND